MAEKVTAGHDLEMDDALALSRAGLSLLGQIVQLRPAASDACDMAADLPIDRVASRPESPRFVGQALANWQSFCRALIEMRSEVPPDGAATFWYPIVRNPWIGTANAMTTPPAWKSCGPSPWPG